MANSGVCFLPWVRSMWWELAQSELNNVVALPRYGHRSIAPRVGTWRVRLVAQEYRDRAEPVVKACDIGDAKPSPNTKIVTPLKAAEATATSPSARSFAEVHKAQSPVL